MRTKIIADWGRVIVERDDPIAGARTRHVYYVPIGGGYVRDNFGQQVCDMLYSRGPTLSSTKSGLLGVIRREYRRRVVSDRRNGL